MFIKFILQKANVSINRIVDFLLKENINSDDITHDPIEGTSVKDHLNKLKANF